MTLIPNVLDLLLFATQMLIFSILLSEESYEPDFERDEFIKWKVDN